jgi:hypothetical protein
MGTERHQSLTIMDEGSIGVTRFPIRAVKKETVKLETLVRYQIV